MALSFYTGLSKTKWSVGKNGLWNPLSQTMGPEILSQSCHSNEPPLFFKWLVANVIYYFYFKQTELHINIQTSITIRRGLSPKQRKKFTFFYIYI